MAPYKTDSFWTYTVAVSYGNWRRNFDGLFSELLALDLDLKTLRRPSGTSETSKADFDLESRFLDSFFFFSSLLPKDGPPQILLGAPVTMPGKAIEP